MKKEKKIATKKLISCAYDLDDNNNNNDNNKSINFSRLKRVILCITNMIQKSLR